MKIYQKNSTIINMLPIRSPHPPNLPNIKPSPSRPSVRWFFRYCYSTRMNLFRTRKLFGIDQLTQIHPHTCVGCPHLQHDPPPPDTLFDNHPEPVVHPRMNSRSEQRASHYVRAVGIRSRKQNFSGTMKTKPKNWSRKMQTRDRLI